MATKIRRYVTMENYKSKDLIPMPEPKPYNKMTDKELQNLLKTNINYNVLIPVLIEITLRKDMESLSLKKTHLCF